MKKLLIAFAAFAALLVSCKDDDGKGDFKPDEPPVTINAGYVGTFTVAPGTDEAFTLEGAEVTVNYSWGNTGVAPDIALAELKMLKVKFAAMMPAMDITIPGVTLTKLLSGEIKISGDNIIPVAMGGPVERYTITNLTGTIGETGSELAMSMTCGTYPLSFTGMTAETN